MQDGEIQRRTSFEVFCKDSEGRQLLKSVCDVDIKKNDANWNFIAFPLGKLGMRPV